MPTKVSKSKARARSVKVQAKLTTLRIAALALGSPARSRRDAIIDRLRAQHLRGEALERQVRRKARVDRVVDEKPSNRNNEYTNNDYAKTRLYEYQL